jgi:hypothetical protein
MNLFVIDAHPSVAARNLSDQHIPKMILETAQILDGGTRPIMHNLQPGRDHQIVKIPPSHRDNRCIHSASCSFVWDYAWVHFQSLLVEFQHRFGHRHAYHNRRLLDALLNRGRICKPHMNLRGFYLAMPDAHKLLHGSSYTDSVAEAVLAYRSYYAAEKTTYGGGKPSTWRRCPPYWLDLAREKSGERRIISSDGRVYSYAPEHSEERV